MHFLHSNLDIPSLVLGHASQRPPEVDYRVRDSHVHGWHSSLDGLSIEYHTVAGDLVAYKEKWPQMNVIIRQVDNAFVLQQYRLLFQIVALLEKISSIIPLHLRRHEVLPHHDGVRFLLE